MSVHPRIYEINTRVWLQQLSNKLNRQINLDNIPPQEWLKIRNLGCDWVWLMGVWQKSLISQGLARKDPNLQIEYSKVLPNWTEQDIVGSPYAVKDYSLNYELGDEDSLDYTKDILHHYGIKLMLDFVPNHTACDHHWVFEFPDYYIQQQVEDSITNLKVEDKYLAYGKDPNYAPWQDTLQLNYFNLDVRNALISQLNNITNHCDGVRCDMAMLVTNDIFANTWKKELEEMGYTKPQEEFWTQAILQIKSNKPSFQFVAECYWNTEPKMQDQGFDFTYDKTLYDMLLENNSQNINNYINSQNNADKWLRFIENHDEKRAILEFGEDRSKAAAILTSFLPGAWLLHQNQERGYKIKLPVQLVTQPQDEDNAKLAVFYRKLGGIINKVFSSNYQRIETDIAGWEDNSSYLNLVSLAWQNKQGIYIVVTNYGDKQSQGKIFFKPNNSMDNLCFFDLLNNKEYIYDSEKIRNEGLFVDLLPWQFHIFEIK